MTLVRNLSAKARSRPEAGRLTSCRFKHASRPAIFSPDLYLCVNPEADSVSRCEVVQAVERTATSRRCTGAIARMPS